MGCRGEMVVAAGSTPTVSNNVGGSKRAVPVAGSSPANSPDRFRRGWRSKTHLNLIGLDVKQNRSKIPKVSRIWRYEGRFQPSPSKYGLLWRKRDANNGEMGAEDHSRDTTNNRRVGENCLPISCKLKWLANSPDRFIMSEYGGIMKRDKRNRNLGACSDKTLGCPSNCTEANVFRCPPELIGG